MNKIIKANELSKAIEEITKDYYDDAIEATKKGIDDETSAAHKILKDNSPVRKGRYKKSLKKKKSFENLTEKRNTLYADKGGKGLSHLLERPHATRNGKRTKAKPHFAPAEQHIKNNLEKKIAENIEKIK